MATKAKTVHAETVRKVGNKVFIRTVTNFYTGEIIAVLPDALVLKDAAWIADTGRFSVALASGSFDEVEPYPSHIVVEVFLGAGADICVWPHPLPRAVK